MMSVDFEKIFSLALASKNPKLKEEKKEAVVPKFSSTSKFDTKNRQYDLVDMWKRAAIFCDELHANINPRWLTLSGVTGCGKTHLAKEIFDYATTYCDIYQKFVPQVNSSITQLHKIEFIEGSMLVDNRINYKDYWRKLCDCHLLVLDDLGVNKISDYAYETTYELLNARLDKWTVLTTNSDMCEILEAFDSRVTDRLQRNGNEFFRSNAIKYIK